jgi:hypothetical protein
VIAGPKLARSRDPRRGDNFQVDESIRVTPEGLSVFAARCAQHGASVTQVAARAPKVAASGQATSAAVGAIHAALGSAGAVLGCRLAATAEAVSGAAVMSATTEEGNAANLSLH